MPKLTTADWNTIKNRLSSVWGSVRLLADGHLVLAVVQQEKMRLLISIHIDGTIMGRNIEYFRESELGSISDIQKKFMNHKFKGPNPKDVKFYEKLKGKKWCKESNIYERHFLTWPYFSTPGAFVAKLKKTCESVELLTLNEYNHRLAVMVKERGEA